MRQRRRRKTYKEALANVEIIIQEWIETAKELDRPIPAPRGRPAFAQKSKTAPFEIPNAKGCATRPVARGSDDPQFAHSPLVRDRTLCNTKCQRVRHPPYPP
jgi:hypothetical protein